MGTLSTITPESDRCCRRAWHKALEDGTLQEGFECPTCGCEYRARDEGAIRVWEYAAWTVRL